MLIVQKVLDFRVIRFPCWCKQPKSKQWSRACGPAPVRYFSQELNRFSKHAEKPPISDASARPGNSHVFRHAFCVRDSRTFWRNPGLTGREQSKRSEIGGRIRTFFGASLRLLNGRGSSHSSTTLSDQVGKDFGKGDITKCFIASAILPDGIFGRDNPPISRMSRFYPSDRRRFRERQ